MKLVIPGAAGFVAVNLLKRLVSEPGVADRFDSFMLVDPLQYGIQKLPRLVLEDPRCEFIQASVFEPEVLRGVLGEGDVVLHLASAINSFTEPQVAVEDNPVRYLTTLAECGVSRLVFVSTADIYGDNSSGDLLEAEPLWPGTIYAAAKAAFEAYLSAFERTHGTRAIVLRPVTIYGPHQYPGWLVPRVISQAIANERITLTGDGSVRRDWIYIDDISDLLIKAILADDSACGHVYNVGTGEEETTLGLTRYVLGRVGRPDSLIAFAPDRPGDIMRQTTSAGKARATFDWAPTVPLRQGLDSTIAWFEDAATKGWA